MKRLLLLALTGLFLAFWLATLRPVYLGGTAGYVLVDGQSMEPSLYSGDLVITRKQQSYAPGDTVAYLVADHIVIHRIVGGDAASGFVLQGDNRRAADVWHPGPEHIIGKQWLRLPGAGRVIEALRAPEVLLALLCGASVWLTLSVLPVTGRTGSRRRVAPGLGFVLAAPTPVAGPDAEVTR